jgi:hypothetical protein
MKHATLLVLLVMLPLSVSAQESSKAPSPPAAQHLPGDLEACRTDIHKYCEAANLKQECLVAHWDHIAETCQNSLLVPMRNTGEGG